MAVPDPQKRIKELEAALHAARAGVEETLKTLQNRLEETRVEKTTFEKTSSIRQKERNEARKERDELKAKVEDLEKKVAAAAAKPALKPPPTAGRPPSSPELDKLKARVPELEMALAASKGESDALRAQLAKAEAAAAAAETAAAATAAAAATPAPSAAPAGEDPEMRERLEARIAELERQVELGTAPQQDFSADERVAQLEATLADEREQNSPLREEAARYKERVRVLEREVAEMRPRQPATPPNKGREAPSDETEKLLARIAELERAVELSGTSGATGDGAADDRVRDLEAQLAEAREANAPALEELAKAKDRIRALEKEVASMRPGAPPLTMPLPQA